MEIMKHVKKLALLMIVALGMSSCGLFNVDVDNTFSGAVDVYVEETMAKGTALEWYDCSGVAVIDALENEDVRKYAEKIDEITVNDIVATVDYVSTGDVVLGPNAVFYLSYKQESASWTQGKNGPFRWVPHLILIIWVAAMMKLPT